MKSRRLTAGSIGFPAVASTLLVLACGASPASSRTSAAEAAPIPSQASSVPALDPQVAATVEQVLGSGKLPGIRWGSIPDAAPTLRPLYENEPDRLLWFEGTTPAPMLETTLAALQAAGDHGLDPADYDAVSLSAEWPAVKSGTVSPAERAYFDLAVSVASARILRAVRLGRVDPAAMNWGYDMAPKQFDVGAALQDVRQRTGLGAALDSLEPPFAHYTRARRTLAAYRTLAAAGEAAPIPDLPKGQTKIVPGRPWEGVPRLAARLRTLGDLRSDATVDDSIYGGPLVDAVKGFQGRHGLEPDGVIGAGTIKALNVPLAQRVRQIELAMERERWLPELSDRPNVFVNVALFRLWADDPASGQEPLRLNVVVGQSLNHKTPIFVEQMEYVIFRPYWNPPRGITVSEIVPKARRDPGYLNREAMEIVAGGDDSAQALPSTPENISLVASGKLRVRQKPGPGNSLGLAKFIFPNDENVYMHGTPAQQLFSRARRDFSHGCIRLEDPARFAEWVLRDRPDWGRAEIDKAMHADRPTRVNLAKPLTVVLFYDTVHVNSEDVAFFVDDIYGHDRALDAALRQGYPYPVKR